jgi:transposase InsO family protein
MTAQVRRIVKGCEVCQMAKSGGAGKAPGDRHLYSGRPWQKLAVDLVGPLPTTYRGNQWILVITDHFTRWQDGIAIPDATAPTVAQILDERIFCYFGLPEQLHSDQGAQFESALMEELCELWGIDRTHTTPYNPRANGMVERNNRVLGDALRTLLLDRTQEEWDLLLPQVMRALRGTPHGVTKETPNFMMLGRELRLPDQLCISTPPEDPKPTHQYAVELEERLRTAQEVLQEQQWQVKQEDTEEPLLFKDGDLVWLENRRRRRGENPKLAPKFLGPFLVVAAYDNHTYRISRQGQESVQGERRLKLFRPGREPRGRAPMVLEPRRRPNMKGAVARQPPVGRRDEPTLEREEIIFPPPEPMVVEPPAVGDTPPLPTEEQLPPPVAEPTPEPSGMTTRSGRTLRGPQETRFLWTSKEWDRPRAGETTHHIPGDHEWTPTPPELLWLQGETRGSSLQDCDKEINTKVSLSNAKPVPCTEDMVEGRHPTVLFGTERLTDQLGSAPGGSGKFPSLIWAQKWSAGDLNGRQRTWERGPVANGQSNCQSVDYCYDKPSCKVFADAMRSTSPRKDAEEVMLMPQTAKKVRNLNTHQFHRINEDSSSSNSDSSSESEAYGSDKENNPLDSGLQAVIRRKKRSSTRDDTIVAETIETEPVSSQKNKCRLLTSLRENIADLEMQAGASRRQAHRLQQLADEQKKIADSWKRSKSLLTLVPCKY